MLKKAFYKINHAILKSKNIFFNHCVNCGTLEPCVQSFFKLSRTQIHKKELVSILSPQFKFRIKNYWLAQNLHIKVL